MKECRTWNEGLDRDGWPAFARTVFHADAKAQVERPLGAGCSAPLYVRAMRER